MARKAAPLNARDMPDVAPLVAEVNRTGRSVLIEAGGQVARLSPLRLGRRRKGPTAADIQAALSTAGAWNDLVDTDQLKADIHAARGPHEVVATRVLDAIGQALRDQGVSLDARFAASS